MTKGFYAQLSFNNLKKNRKIYIPYILTCIITITMFYMIHSLSVNQSIAAMHGGKTIQSTLNFGTVIVGIFAVIFLFYTNSFVIKRRKKEFGLYNVLGMEKRHLGIVLIFETLYIALTSIIPGLSFGVILDKLMYLIIARILHADYGATFFLSWQSMLITLVLFAVIFVCIYLFSFIRVQVSQPIELLKSENAGEKEPKTRHIMAGIGAVCLATGYACAVFTKDAVSALALFFIAVILVILGTYFLFIAGSIALLKLLKKNKKYYYKTNHFTSVSGMTYRMKQNSVGLASICILFTMLLVTISTTTSFMLGRNDMIAQKYPYDFTVQASVAQTADNSLIEDIRTLFDKNNLDIKEEAVCRYLTISANQNGNEFSLRKEHADKPLILIVLTADTYNSITGQNKTLGGNEIIINEDNFEYGYNTVEFLDTEYTVKEKVASFVKGGFELNGIPNVISGLWLCVIVSDDTVLNTIYDRYRSELKEEANSIQLSYGADVKADKQTQITFFDTLNEMLREKNYNARALSRSAQADEYMSIYGGLFFIGVYLGLLFLMATILIIYYKQISEGYEDKKRFEIMQKVGMSYAEVKRSINSQILIVFFLPLIMAGIHVAFAFPMINSIMGLLALVNTKLFALCTLGCFALFSVVYVVVYLLTAKVYYRIVKNG
ncbi:MAG: ABC transporter permease [Clostridia bacterium]|nr:ABC transporter permease [Clostridia bacterium]